MARKHDEDENRLDIAARAGWLYYIAGNTPDEIARKLGVSRQTAQRLVSTSISEKLIRVRLDHPIGRCLEMAENIKTNFGIEFCDCPESPELADVNDQPQQHQQIGFEGGAQKSQVISDCPDHKDIAVLGEDILDVRLIALRQSFTFDADNLDRH